MKIVKDLLSVYKNIQTPQGTIKKAIKKAIEKNIEITISLKDIKVTNGIVWINAPSVVKNEIRIYKTIILNSIGEEIKDMHVIHAIM